MTPKIVLTVIGILMLVHGIAFFFGASTMAKMGVPDISEQALKMSVGVHEIVAMCSVFLGIVLIFSRDIDTHSAKKVLTGTGIGLLVLTAGIIYHMITLKEIPEQAPPTPMPIIAALLTVWAFYVALAKKEDTEETQ